MSEQIGTTRAGNPIETSTSIDTEAIKHDEQAMEHEIQAEREQIGTTRGGQPIESFRHDSAPDTE